MSEQYSGSSKVEATYHGPPSQETICDEHKAQYFDSGYEAGNKDATEQKEALLGLATTRQLLEELRVRFQVSTPHSDSEQWMGDLLVGLSDKVLDYRTVDDHG